MSVAAAAPASAGGRCGGVVCGVVLGDVPPPPAEDDVAVLDPDGVVGGDVAEVPEHDLAGEDGPRERAHLEVSPAAALAAAQEAVGDLGHEPGDQPGVEEGDVGDPDHAKDERHHEEEEVGRSAQRPVRLQAGDVRDLYRRKLVLQDEMDEKWNESRV